MLRKAIVFLFSIVVLGCSIIGNNEEKKDDKLVLKPNKGSIVINFPEESINSSRGVLPTSRDVDYFIIKVSNNDGYSDKEYLYNAYGSVKFEDLDEGSYTIEVEAYKKGGGFSPVLPSILLFKGSKNTTVEAGETAYVTIELDYEGQVDTGDISIGVSFPKPYSTTDPYSRY